MGQLTKDHNALITSNEQGGGKGNAIFILIALCLILGLLSQNLDQAKEVYAPKKGNVQQQLAKDFTKPIAGVKNKNFLEFDKDGTPKLASWRQRKLERELKDLRSDAEQYVLFALQDGYYPCFSCVDRTQIYLKTGEIWKYGVTTKGERGRYQDWVAQNGLKYQIEFMGSLQKCLEMERIKIYNYPLHLECQQRDFYIIRPPGNKKDS